MMILGITKLYSSLVVVESKICCMDIGNVTSSGHQVFNKVNPEIFDLMIDSGS